MAKRIIAICGLPLLCLLPMIKPAVVKIDGSPRLLVLLRWQSGAIRFVNSVTGRPVTIRFRIGGTFQDFSMHTDETTEAYYTNGVYAIDAVISKEATDVLSLCSIKGIALRLGFYRFSLKDSCMEIKMLWRI